MRKALWVAAVGVLLAWIVWWIAPASPPSPVGMQADDGESNPVVSDPREWVAKLHRGDTEVELRQRAMSSDGKPAEVILGNLETIGRLLPEEVPQVRATISDLERVRERWWRQAQSRFERSGDVLDNLEFARCLVDVEEARAALRALEDDSYYVQKGDHAMPAVAGVRYVGVSVARGDASLFVTIALVVANHGALGAALEYLDVADNQAAAQACEHFNRLSQDQRRALIERFRTAGDDLRRKDPELARFFRAGLQITDRDLLVRR